MADVKVSALTELSVPALEDLFYTVDDPSGTPASRKVVANRVGGLFVPGICDGRLSLNAGSPITTDVISSTGVYFSPYQGNRIALYDGTRWKLYTFSTLTHNLGTVVDATNYDIFVYDNAGTLTIEKLAWTNATTRATALAEQDGVWCQSGALTRRYLGTIRTVSTAATADSAARRFVWNQYNRVPRSCQVPYSGADTSYTTAAWRQFAASTTYQLAYVCGQAYEPVQAWCTAQVGSGFGQTVGVGIGVDSTTANSAYGGVRGPSVGTEEVVHQATYLGLPGLGYHYLAFLQWGGTSATVWRGSTDGKYTPGIFGVVYA